MRLGAKGSPLALTEDAELALMTWACLDWPSGLDLDRTRKALGQSAQRWRRALGYLHDVSELAGLTQTRAGAALHLVRPKIGRGPVNCPVTLRLAALVATVGPPQWRAGVDIVPTVLAIGAVEECDRVTVLDWWWAVGGRRFVSMVAALGLAYVTDGRMAAVVSAPWRRDDPAFQKLLREVK